MPKIGEVYKYFVQDFLKNFSFRFYLLKNVLNPQDDESLVDKSIISSSILPCWNGTAVRRKIILYAKVQNSVFFERYHIQVSFATDLP